MEDIVSVIMSAYNESESQLSASIESILNQTYTSIEFVIVNDNPKNEELRQVLERYAQQDQRIVPLENPENMGLVNSLNRAISRSTGKYLARMDADDIARPDRIQKQIEFLKARNLDFVGGYIALMDEDGNAMNRVMRFPVKHSQICRGMFWGSCIPHPTWLLRREVYESMGGYRQIPYAEDYDFILRVLKTKFKTGNIPCVVLDYRIRSSGISVSNSLKQEAVRHYLAENRRNVSQISEQMVARRMGDSHNPVYLYKEKKKKLKSAIKNKEILNLGIRGCKVIVDKYFWLQLGETVWHIFH